MPEDIELGIEPHLLDEHIAVDIGVGGIAERLARRHNIRSYRDRQPPRSATSTARKTSLPWCRPRKDGTLMPGNIGADIEKRLDLYHRPYHTALASFIMDAQPR